ncbi:MAG TPA: GNAT family N-acetyltransferase [Actinomycetota bacterium]
MAIEVRALAEEELEDALPLIAGYQVFYEAQPDDEHNRGFFRRFLAPSDEGLLLGAWENGRLAGFATIYWTYSSTLPGDIALMNDLFVAEDARGRGVGEALIDACVEAARERGLPILEWYTATDNHRAQRLYDRYPGAEKTTWHAYDVEAAGESASATDRRGPSTSR